MSRTIKYFLGRGGILAGGIAWLLASIPFAAPAQINLSNYSSTNPILVMAMGDSITDDCETNGAWRAHLQPLLDNGGIPFNFIGREASAFNTNIPTFTKLRHEGYCGAVIASPGVSPPDNFYTAAENYLDYIAPGALGANTPNLMLILIGANDMGHGRLPALTGGEIMSNFLNIVYSDAPNTYVIISKITTLSNAALSYAPYATNVPLYNAALQWQVNKRRLKGQHIALADMFSVVPYATGFMSDHLHPNATGLADIAQEFYTRIQCLLTNTNPITAQLIYGGDTWSYNDTGTDLGTNWIQPGYDDSQWKTGLGRFGYGESTADGTVVSNGGNSNNVNTTTYFIKKIVVPWNQYFTNLNFRLTQSAGAVVYLNGQELYRTNLPSGPITYSTFATNVNLSDPEFIYYQTNFSMGLNPGTNVIAVEVHQSSLTNSILGFDMELFGGAWLVPPPTISASVNNSTINLSWPVTNGVAFSLYSSAQPTGPWQAVPAPYLTNNGTISTAVQAGPSGGFFELQLNTNQ